MWFFVLLASYFWVSWLAFLCHMCFPCLLSWLALFSPLLKQVRPDPVRCLPKSVVSYFWGCRVNFPRCFPFCSQGFALLVSILCSLCLLCGPWCQTIIIISWFALFPSLLCSLCLRCFPSSLNGLPLVLCLWGALLRQKLALGHNVIFVLLDSYFWVCWLVFLCAFHAF